MMRPVTRLGPFVLHWEVALVALGLGVLARPAIGVAFAGVVLFHELGHALVAASLRALPRASLRLQLGSGEAYLPETSTGARGSAVLLAGAVIGGPLAWGLAGALARAGPPLLHEIGVAGRYLTLLWSVYQLSLVPVADGGAILRRALSPRFGPLFAWRVGWLLGALTLGAGVLFLPLSHVLWLAALSVVLGRSEAGHVRALEAHAALERGEGARAIALARKAPGHLAAGDRARLAEVGLHAALESGDVEAAEALVGRIDPASPFGLEAVTWLLRQDRDAGALVAERVHDRVDKDLAPGLDEERYVDLTFYHAIHEATRLRPESALGLLERAVERGFDDGFRVEAEGAFDRLRDHPRFLRVLSRFS